MKDEQLLSVMFDDASDFREQLFGESVRQLRRKRRRRNTGRILLTLVIAAVAIWGSLPQRRTFHSVPQEMGIRIVRTAPLSAGHFVTTQPESVTIISSDKSSLVLLGDDQLLDLVPGETKLLVWHAPHRAELVVVGP